MSEALRIAVIGGGQIAQRGHIPGYIQGGAQVVALCDKNQLVLESVSQQYQIKRRYQDWQKMLADGGFDAVSICTPPYLHSEMAVESSQHGYHVLVEKPIAVSLEQCDRMIEAAQNGGVILMISHNQRFMGPHRIAKDILDSGRLGMVYLIHGVFGHQGPEIWSPTQEWYFQPEQAGLGVCADLGYHKIDLIRWITNQEITSISAFKNTFEKQTALEDTAVFCFQLSRGSLGTIQVSWVFRPDWENSLTIRCEKGVIRIPTEANEPVKVLTNQGTSTLVEANYQCSSPDTSGWFGAVGAFLEAVKNGLPSPVPGDDARASLAVVLAANLSANQKKVIDLQGKP